MTINMLKKIIIYSAGLLTMAIGINISKLSVLGITPVSSIARAWEQIFRLTFGTTTLIINIILLLGQLLILRRDFRLRNFLGLPLTAVFGLLLDIMGTDPEAIGHLLINFPRPEGYHMKFIYMILSIVILGIGVFLHLRPKWAPLPPEGLALSISEKTGIVFGNCKSFVDTVMIVIAMILQIMYLGGFQSFMTENVVVREGTIIAAISVGQVVRFVAKRWAKPIDEWLLKNP